MNRQTVSESIQVLADGIENSRSFVLVVAQNNGEGHRRPLASSRGCLSEGLTRLAWPGTASPAHNLPSIIRVSAPCRRLQMQHFSTSGSAEDAWLASSSHPDPICRYADLQRLVFGTRFWGPNHVDYAFAPPTIIRLSFVLSSFQTF